MDEEPNPDSELTRQIDGTDRHQARTGLLRSPHPWALRESHDQRKGWLAWRAAVDLR